MNYRLELSSEDYDSFKLEIVIGGDKSLLSLHEKIFEILNYDTSHIASFFMLDSSGERGKEIMLFDMSDSDSDMLSMEDTKIEDVISPKCMELDYVYDIFSDKYFRLEYIGRYTDEENDIAPKLIKCSEFIPPQFSAEDAFEGLDDDFDDDMDYMEESSTASYDFDDDEDFDDDGYKPSRRRKSDDGFEYDNIDDYLDSI